MSTVSWPGRDRLRARGMATADRIVGQVRDFVRDLYKYEIRRLRDRMLRNEFPRNEYAARVDALRRCYPVLALLPHQSVE